MASDILEERSKKYLRKFSLALEEILECMVDPDPTTPEIDKGIAALAREIEAEIVRVERRGTTGAEYHSYLPALQEASMYLDKHFNAKSDDDAIDALHDTQTSIDYFLFDLGEK